MLLVTWVLLEYVNNNMQLKMNEKTGWPNDLPATVTAKTHDVGHATTTTTKPTKSAPGGTSTNNGQIGTTNAAGFYFVTPKDGERNFYDLGVATSTDKVTVPRVLPGCLEDDSSCTRPSCVRPECRAWGHHYDTLYQQRLGPYSREDVAPFQFLEIGFYNGAGYDLYREFLPRGECHSMEIACIEEGPVEEGKWPWGNFAAKNPRYQQYLDEGLLHCGDANDVVFLDKIWREKMNRDDAPPLRIVVDDGAHLAEHMVQTLFYWFPKIQPRGLLIVEDIQPIQEANAFRTQFLPQIMKDLHFCGDPKEKKDDLCFPTISLLLASIHCEMHICIFERNDKPAKELTLEESKSPDNALDMSKCKSKVHGHW
eukprot:CAMPEP_0172510260 /NCGR_PEP_ID=MMETSP1066-20121228/227394_1 /TAXON_ID=671091 /ORGANISM="Coscinodiscus wailesii, Strain CCMP2513" /LENGTH=367 /DNA_ID=CAMNT_0013289141 /DNA_START=117 /DNA_END=1217 /DNA_ORIENTATION=+